MHVYAGQQTCTCICIRGCAHVGIHMHVCCPDGRGGGSGGMVGGQASLWIKAKVRAAAVAHVQGEWRASDGSSLAGCSVPAGPHRPTTTDPHHHLSPLFSLCPQGPVLKMPVHWDTLCAVCNPTHSIQTHAHTQAFVRKEAQAHTHTDHPKEPMVTSEPVSLWRVAS